VNFTPVILTKNEELNIDKCIKNLTWSKQIIIIDSYSSDKTIPIALKYKKNVKILRCKKSETYVSKINLVLKYYPSKWILLLDADYELEKKTKIFLRFFKPNNFYSAYSFKIKNILDSKILDAELYPSKALLFNSKLVNFTQDGHKEKIIIKGKIRFLNLNIFHSDKKKFNVWFTNQIKYSKDEVNKIFKKSFLQRDFKSKIRSIPFTMNIALVFYLLLYKKVLKFGIPGMKYFLQRQLYEFILALIYIYNFFSKKIK